MADQPIARLLVVPSPYGRRHALPSAAGTRCAAFGGQPMAGAVSRSKGGPMQRDSERLAALVVLLVGLMVALSASASAATNQISGVGVFDSAGECPDPPTGFEDFTMTMTGSLQGCWYTDIVTTKESPSGVYQERGEEVFVGSLNGGPEGTFATTYKFTSKWDPDVSTGSEVRGRCQHPIVVGSGTGGFKGVTGRVDFKDDVVAAEYLYRGHIALP